MAAMMLYGKLPGSAGPVLVRLDAVVVCSATCSIAAHLMIRKSDARLPSHRDVSPRLALDFVRDRTGVGAGRWDDRLAENERERGRSDAGIKGRQKLFAQEIGLRWVQCMLMLFGSRLTSCR